MSTSRTPESATGAAARSQAWAISVRNPPPLGSSVSSTAFSPGSPYQSTPDICSIVRGRSSCGRAAIAVTRVPVVSVRLVSSSRL